MNKRDIASYLGIDRTTLYNWEKNKPNLYATVMKGLKFDEIVDKMTQNVDELKSIRDEYPLPEYMKK